VSRVEALLDALRTHGPRLVHVSSAHADGKRRSSAVWKAQQKLFRSVHPYFAIKQQTEARIRAAMAAGLEATIVRPTACLGPWDIKRREDCWIPKLIAGEVPGILSHRLNIIDTRDLAIAVRAAVEGECIGETMLLAGHNTTTEHLVAQLCDAAGVVAPRLRMPAELSVLPLLWIETLWATVGSASPLPSLVPALLCEQEWVDQSRAANRLGVRPRPLQTTAHDTVAWYQSMAYC
jgi:nucleoside-diphosphate-sugar epimerase